MAESRDAWKARMGVGTPQHVYGRLAGSTNVTPVVADDGPLRGYEVGARREHWSGRVDSKVTAATVHLNPNLRPDPNSIARKAPCPQQ